ncbi:MAG: GNAT family N-acetyltransferase [Gammaproteobacteria bacterium]|nr:GNAT family N-acetyltransferase [Gammaproteobacteria bacterium]
MAIEYHIGFPEFCRQRAAELYDEAFQRKFKPIIASDELRVAILAESICPDFAVTAFKGDQLVGIAGFHEENFSFTGGGSARGVLKRLGWLKGLRAILLFALFERNPRHGELLMDGIVVDDSERGKGVGSGILERLTEYAISKKYKTLRLDVVDTNPRAKQLYQRQGFVATHTQHHPYLKNLFGFSASTTMVKNLAGKESDY